MDFFKTSMYRAVLFLAFTSACLAQPQQQQAIPVNPVDLLQKLFINKVYDEVNFPVPAGMHRMFVDSLRIEGVVKAFTALDVEGRRNGWRVWMDFDADRWNELRLVAVRMRHTPAGDVMKAFKDICQDVNKRMPNQVSTGVAQGKTAMLWEWIPRGGYRLLIEVNKREIEISLRFYQ